MTNARRSNICRRRGTKGFRKAKLVVDNILEIQKTKVKGARSKVKGARGKVKGARTKDKGAKLEVLYPPPSLRDTSASGGQETG